MSVYHDSSQPVDARVEDLLAQMTVEEKVAQLGSIWGFQLGIGGELDEAKASTELQHGMGQITRISGGSMDDPATSASFANAIQKYLRERTRLGIPAIVHEECCAGFCAKRATVFPQIMGLACTWNPELAEAMTLAIQRQMRAVGSHFGLSPVLDVARDPRWGRVEETFGEDPYLITSMGLAYIRGLQGEARDGVIATGKHFAAYAISEGGMNWAPVHVNEREFREVYLMPFEAAVKQARLGSIMNGYHEIDGVPCAADHSLLTDTLRDHWGFDGIVVSDYFSVRMLFDYHFVAPTKGEAAAQALRAGLDVELPGTDCYGAPLLEVIRSGGLEMAVVDEAVRRVLRQKFELGLFDNPYVDAGRAPDVFDTAEDRALARTIASQSIVLLKNENNLLPLHKDIRKIAVIGPNAHSARSMNGDYHFPAHIEAFSGMLISMGEGKAILPTPPTNASPLEAEAQMYRESYVPFVTVLDGIRAKTNAEVVYAKGCDIFGESTDGFAEAVAAAKGADSAVLVLGGKSGLVADCTSGEARDSATLELTGPQQQLVDAVLATGTPTIVVLITGRVSAIPDLAERVPAILHAWIPGEEGGSAVADVLFGDVNPSGRLAMTLPRSSGQIPIFYNHKPSGGRSAWLQDYIEVSTKPLYPFGHGLSYTTFEYSDLQVSPESVEAGGDITVSFRVTNIGSRAGDEVAQIYLQDPAASVTRPVKELKGFQRLSLQPGASKTVTFTLNTALLAFYNRGMEYVVEPGEIRVYVGASSEDIRLTGAFAITGDTITVKERVFLSDVRVNS
jgi:beta-glucosidase